MFIATLFTIVKTWKQPKCPLAKEWIKKVCYMCTMEKKKIMPFEATWMDLEIVILN